MREELEDVLELYAGMPPEGQVHWRARSLPAVEFVSDAERAEFVTALDQREKKIAQPVTPASVQPASGGAAAIIQFAPGQRVKANLAGLVVGKVQFSQNVEAAYATVEREISADPPVYRLKLLISFRGVTQVDVPADRIRPM
jgi:hypothetical protein